MHKCKMIAAPASRSYRCDLIHLDRHYPLAKAPCLQKVNNGYGEVTSRWNCAPCDFDLCIFCV